MPPESAVQLYGYQRRWLADRARFKEGRLARQTGKSFMTTLEAAFDMAEHAAPWVILSSGERASREDGIKLAMHLRAIGLAAEPLEGYAVFDQATYKVHEIALPNGARAVCLPANPDTSRGHSANVLLDEYAFHQDSRRIWAALFPTITRGYKIRVVSTPQGKKNKFYEICTSDAFSHHTVTIVDALADGLELRDEDGRLTTAEELRVALGDDEAWEQEYMVVFLDEATAWLSYDMIGLAESQEIQAMPSWAADLVAAAERAHAENPSDVRVVDDVALPFFNVDVLLGFDVARRRDLAVIWLLADPGPGLVKRTLAAIDFRRRPFGVMERVVWTLIERARVRRACIDQSGLGMQLAERALEKYGEHLVEGIDFTAPNKEVLAGRLKTSFEDRLVQVPLDRPIRESLHSLKRIETGTGHFRFDADRDEKTGHADHAWALALALHAGSAPSGRIEHGSTGRRRESGRALDRFMGTRAA